MVQVILIENKRKQTEEAAARQIPELLSKINKKFEIAAESREAQNAALQERLREHVRIKCTIRKKISSFPSRPTVCFLLTVRLDTNTCWNAISFINTHVMFCLVKRLSSIRLLNQLLIVCQSFALICSHRSAASLKSARTRRTRPTARRLRPPSRASELSIAIACFIKVLSQSHRTILALLQPLNYLQLS